MNELDFIEDQGRRSAAFSLEGMELMSKRAHTLATLLIGGAGAVGAFALGQIGKPGGAWVPWILGGISVFWFALASVVVIFAMRTREVRPPATGPAELLQHLRGPLAEYIKELETEGKELPDALTLLREGEIRNLQITSKAYSDNVICTAKVLDSAYIAVACTPLVALLGFGVALLIKCVSA